MLPVVDEAGTSTDDALTGTNLKDDVRTPSYNLVTPVDDMVIPENHSDVVIPENHGNSDP